MVYLFGAVLVLALLYFWLLGHWYARVLVFPALSVLFGIIAFVSMTAVLESVLQEYLISHSESTFMPWSTLFGLIIGPVAGWFASMIPTYYWRHQNAPLLRRLNSHLHPDLSK